MKKYINNLQDVNTSGTYKSDRTGVGTLSTHNKQLRVDLKDGFPLLTTKKVSMINILTEWKWMMLGMTDARWLQDNKCTIWDEWATISKCNKFFRVVGDMGPVYGHQWRNFGATKRVAFEQLWDIWRSKLLRAPTDLNFDDVSNPYDLRDTTIANLLDDRSSSVPFPRDSAEEYGLGRYVYAYNKNGFDQVAWVLRELITNPNSRRLIVSGWNPKEQGDVELPPCHTLWQLQTTANTQGDVVLNLSLHARSVERPC